VLLEALSYGSSCLVSDIPANREVSLEEERYFMPGDIDVMTEKLGKFLGQPCTEDQRRDRIRRIADQHDWLQIAEKTLKVYDKIMNRRSGYPLLGRDPEQPRLADPEIRLR
jgi:glycosyltransferase involved in cell wall biosynthesis